jgi:integrase
MQRVTGHISLRKRKRGPVWYLRYRLADGRQVQKLLGPAWAEKGRPISGYFTKKMAQDELREVLSQARSGTLPGSQPRSGHTFGDACAEWLRYVEHDKQRRPSTLSDYRNTVNGHLLPEFGADTPLEQITTDRIELYRARMLDEGKITRRSIQKTLVLLHGILKRAKRNRRIIVNPAEDVERVTVKRTGDFNVLSAVEVAAVTRAAENEQDAAIYTVAAFTGLRLGELRALRWRDVEFDKRSLRVCGSYTLGQLGPPKSGRIRSVPLIDQAAVALDGLSRRELFVGPDDLVFCTPLGHPFDADSLRQRFYEALDKAGLGAKRTGSKPIVFHDLRHTFGTLAVEAWPLHDVQAYMGHANVTTTMIYVHHQPKASAADKLSALVAAATAGENVSRTVSPNAEIGAQLSATQTT